MARLTGGRTTDDVRPYVGASRYPLPKHDAVHAARQKGR
jgi:hypothetical protein